MTVAGPASSATPYSTQPLAVPVLSDDDLNSVQRKPNWCCTLTAAGRSAVAVIQLGGPDCEVAVETLFDAAGKHPMAIGQIRYGHWRPSGEAVVVTPIDERRVEVHCHGGVAAANRILADLAGLGFAEVPPPPGARDPDIAAAMTIASRCMTARTAAIAMDQVRGAFADWIAGPMTSPSIDEVLRWARWSTRLDRPMEVVIAGSPNVGKSTLINALVGYQRAITMDMPGTTRDVVTAETVIDGWPLRLSDTAGIRSAEGDDDQAAIEREGIRRAGVAAAEADLVIVVRDAGPPIEIPNHWSRVIRVCNKSDLGVAPESGEIAISAAKREGIESLCQSILERLVPDRPPPGAPVCLTTEQRQRVELRRS